MDLDERELSIEEGHSPTTWKSRTVPLSVRLQIPKPSGQAKTFSVMRFPQDLDAFSLFCRATIGKSGTFCITKNCTVNHQGSVAKIKPGSLIVVKLSGKSAFLNPLIKAGILDQSLLGDWLSTQETLESWSTKFDQALGSSAFVTKVNAAALEVTRDEERRAAEFKTPKAKKRRSMEFDSTERIGISPYARALLNGPEVFESLDENQQREKLIQMVLSLDAGVDQLGSFYVSLNQELENASNVQGLSNQMLEHQVNLVRRTLGSKPDHLKAGIEAPTVWGTISAVIQRIDGRPIELPELHTNGHLESPADWTKRMLAMDTDLLATASTLSKAIQGQGHRIDAIQDKASLVSPSALAIDGGISEKLKEDMKDMRGELQRINTENKPHVVKFAGLNLDSLSKARSWISSHVASKDIGLVVDAHTVFEHIHANVSGGEFLKNFE
jgi:hypothetical protein